MNMRADWHLTELVGHEAGRGNPFAAAMRATRMPMVITNPRLPDNPIIFANDGFQTLTGYDRQHIIGRNGRFLQGKATDPSTVAKLRRAIRDGESVTVDLLNYRRDGSMFWNSLYVSPVRSDRGDIHYYVALQVDVTERVEWQQRASAQHDAMEEVIQARTSDLAAALEAKTTLLHEVDHRVKNNLMLVGSLLRLQSRSLPDVRLRQTLEHMLQRVDALSSVHRRLYQTADLDKFDIGSFVLGLAGDLIGASGRKDITLGTDIMPLDISARKAASVGLILNEVITNALTHGFANGRPGKLRIGVRGANGMAQIDITDDGPGFDTSMKPTASIGRILIERLSRQVQARTVWNGDAPGTHVSISVPTGD